MNILKDLWEGNIFPNETAPSMEFRVASGKVAAEREKLLAILNPQQQTAAEKLFALQAEQACLGEYDSFVCGFRLAVHFLMEGCK